VKNIGLYPSVHADTNGACVVSQAGGVVLVEAVRASGLDAALSTCPVPEPVATAPRPAPGRSCGPVIFVDESAEYRSSLDRHSQIDCSVWLVVRCLLLSTLVWPMLVVVRLPFGQYAA